MDIGGMYRDALERTGKIVAGVRPEQYGGSTPCTEWDVRTLTEHIVGANFMFAGAIRGQDVAHDHDAPASADILGDDAGAAYDTGTREVLAAWGEPGAMERTVQLPIGPVPAPVAQCIHLLDLVVHGWDLAKATGQDTSIDEGTAEALLATFRESLGKEEARAGVFKDQVPVPDDAPAGDRLVAFLGRQP